jgi:hypothetical protein
MNSRDRNYMITSRTKALQAWMSIPVTSTAVPGHWWPRSVPTCCLFHLRVHIASWVGLCPGNHESAGKRAKASAVWRLHSNRLAGHLRTGRRAAIRHFRDQTLGNFGVGVGRARKRRTALKCSGTGPRGLPYCQTTNARHRGVCR